MLSRPDVDPRADWPRIQTSFAPPAILDRHRFRPNALCAVLPVSLDRAGILARLAFGHLELASLKSRAGDGKGGLRISDSTRRLSNHELRFHHEFLTSPLLGAKHFVKRLERQLPKLLPR